MMFVKRVQKNWMTTLLETDHNVFCLKPQHTIAKATKTKLTRAEKRASKQAHAALVSLPSYLIILWMR